MNAFSESGDRRMLPYYLMLKPKSVRHIFAPVEDIRLKQLVAQYGEKDWKRIADEMPNRSPRQCRERYKNYLALNLTTFPWTTVEDDLLRDKVREFGSKWARMAVFFPGRTGVSLKNHWAAMLSRQSRPELLSITETVDSMSQSPGLRPVSADDFLGPLPPLLLRPQIPKPDAPNAHASGSPP
jgi:hypothetical protein